MYDLGDLGDPAVVLFGLYSDQSGIPGQSGYEILQFCMKEACISIPAVSQWGIVVIALLLAAGGTMVIRRRRAMAT